MKNQTKHRILGILVVTAFVILLLPFLQTEKEIKPEIASAKTPAFPEQVKASYAEDTIQPEPLIEANANEEIRNIPLPLAEEKEAITNVIPIAPPVAVKENFHHEKVPLEKMNKKVAQNSPKIFAKKSFINDFSTDQNGLIKLKQSAWVIQIGSFRDKNEALRLVNRLRKNGYPAFIQNVKTRFQSLTQVYIGPTTKQKEAFQLVDELAAAQHIKGIVVSYQPLTL